MAIPPFPSQDLAKLVLGYLAEEQLMTAYDEFLQASPYLDAMHNEYDRIFMTSLKNILAEYRAVKIYVETCKPVLLRKKLFQCVNLLDIVKFLVNNIDVEKLCALDIGEKKSLEKHVSLETIGCNVCNSLKLTHCVCKEKQNKQNPGNNDSVSQSRSPVQGSIETTSLADLPGNHLTVKRKKQAKTIEKKAKRTILQSSGNIVQNEICTPQTKACITNCSAQQSLSKTNDVAGHLNIQQNPTLSNSNTQPTYGKGSIRNISECNNVDLVKNNVGICSRNSSKLENNVISSPFQDFASGVRGCENRSAIVPDSSTSDNTNLQTRSINNNMNCQREPRKSQIVLKIEPVHKKGGAGISTISASYSQSLPKTDEHKIRILSDVKVDNTKNNERKFLPTSRNATSTPLMHMQTIVINGTPAYRPQPITAHQQNFTKDEIMAMPTIIVVPASGSQHLTSSQTGPMTSQNSNIVEANESGQNDIINKVLSPLVIDVSPSSTEENSKGEEIAEAPVTVEHDVGLIKTVDISAQQKITSLPKNSNTTCTAETSTPLVMPPLRKSSSTPRRTSHVRVLDFTTPRRILHETIMEQGVQVDKKPVDVVVSKSNNIILEKADLAVCENNIQKPSIPKLVTLPPKNKAETVLISKKNNWDHDLRAMIAKNDVLVPKINSNPRLKSTKKKKMSTKKSTDKEDKDDDKNDILEKKSKGCKTKKRKILEEDDEVPILPTKPDSVPIKPTITIKPAVDWEPTSISATKKDIEENQMKSKEDEHIDTPEVERLTLQNVIGSKLNISDLLETPYKQVFYDIQMETPRCFGPDVPDEPMSDIKIMNIPTPRFFNSPKIIQATPSSYSSRPTDYSSGGSYYKPDDQDYLPIPEIRCPVTSSREELNGEVIKYENIDKKTTRPVRQCAKNVSYYASNKVKDSEDKTDVASTCIETTNNNTSVEFRVLKDKSSKGNKTDKVERSKRSGKKKKSPLVKDKPKTFMKIKPRRVTPTKENLSGKSRKRTLQINSPKLQRKRTTSKEKNVNLTPLVTSIPNKSRRKSSTPRKLHCSKTFNSESSGHNSPEISTQNKQQNTTRDTNSINTQDSDTEQLNLRWSDDGSQDIKLTNETNINVSESEDISKIQEYIKATVSEEPIKEGINIAQPPLVNEVFDDVTAKNIERDLLDTPPCNELDNAVQQQVTESKEQTEGVTTSANNAETDTSVTNELQIAHDNTDDEDEIELSVHETNNETGNWRFLTFTEDNAEVVCNHPSATLKDTFSMEVCIEDGMAIRLRATPSNLLFELEPAQEDQPFCDKEIEEAVKSISNIEKLYTPLKDSLKAQCYEIFDSTLTSLDTPLKVGSPKKGEREITVTEIVFEEDKTENKDKTETKKRKRLANANGSEESSNESKKNKPDPQYLLRTANIQNIDIESVLKKLHGP